MKGTLLCLCNTAQLSIEHQLCLLDSMTLQHSMPALLHQHEIAALCLALLELLVQPSLPHQEAMRRNGGAAVQALIRLQGPPGRQSMYSQGRHKPMQVVVLELLRGLVVDNEESQQWLAEVPGAITAMVQLLGSEDSDVGNVAAETLAVLQQGGPAVRVAVRQAGRGVVLELGKA